MSIKENDIRLIHLMLVGRLAARLNINFRISDDYKILSLQRPKKKFLLLLIVKMRNEGPENNQQDKSSDKKTEFIH